MHDRSCKEEVNVNGNDGEELNVWLICMIELSFNFLECNNPKFWSSGNIF